jgi:hypothetical protein
MTFTVPAVPRRVRTVDGRASAAAVGLGVLTTVCCARRWNIVAGGLGVDLTLHAAVAAYYGSPFVNVALRARSCATSTRVSHGRDVSAASDSRSVGHAGNVIRNVRCRTSALDEPALRPGLRVADAMLALSGGHVRGLLFPTRRLERLQRG